MNKYLCIATLILISIHTNAEVYRWTDNNGKVHYTDKKPKESAENITNKVKKQNIDSGTEERRKVGEILRKENDADRQFYQQQKARAEQQQYEKDKRCQKAKKYLSNISGRVQFLDDDGKPMQVTEQERQEHAEKFKAIVEQECNQ